MRGNLKSLVDRKRRQIAGIMTQGSSGYGESSRPIQARLKMESVGPIILDAETRSRNLPDIHVLKLREQSL
jgi:hypothetical protein